MTPTSKTIKPGVSLCLGILIAALLMHSGVYADAGLVLLMEGKPGGVVNGLSQDGSVAAGTIIVGANENDAAFIWNESDGLVQLGYLPGQFISEALGISDDGLKIFGTGDSAPWFTWTQAGGMEAISTAGLFNAISGDGSALVGFLDSSPDEAIRVIGDTVTTLGWLSTYGPTKDRSIAHAVSGNGTVVVGQSTSDTGSFSSDTEAFRWAQGGQMTGLGFEVSGETHNQIIAKVVSRNGEIIAGTSRSATPAGDTLYNIFIWTEATGMVQIHSSLRTSEVHGISADGSVIVGMFRPTISTRETPGGFMEPFRWTQATGMQSVIEWLQEAGVDTGTLNNGSATAISADGNTIGGRIRDSENTDAGYRPYIAHVISDDVFVDGFE